MRTAKPFTIQVVTDISDISYNEMFGVMHGVASAMSHEPVSFAPLASVAELSIVHAAFVTRLLVKSYLSPVVIFTNVAPHQTHKYDIIAKIKGKDIILIGSNNGVYDWLAKEFEFDYLGQINVKKPFVIDGKIMYLPGETPPIDYDSIISSKTEHYTFSAHTILGSITVGLALGVDYRKFSEDRDLDIIVPLDLQEGEVVHIDNYGNAKIFGSPKFKPKDKVTVYVNGSNHAHAQFITDRMMSYPTNTYVIYPSTSLRNMTDLALVRGDAGKELGLKIGDVVRFEAFK